VVPKLSVVPLAEGVAKTAKQPGCREPKPQRRPLMWKSLENLLQSAEDGPPLRSAIGCMKTQPRQSGHLLCEKRQGHLQSRLCISALRILADRDLDAAIQWRRLLRALGKEGFEELQSLRK